MLHNIKDIGRNYSILIFPAVIFLLSYFIFQPSYAEDAYIFFRYAQNFTDGIGLNYNPHERVEGYSSLLWVLLLSIGPIVKIEIPLWANLLSFSLCLLIIIRLYQISLSILGNSFFSILPSLLLTLNLEFTYMIGSGLDESLFIYLLISAIYYHYIENKEGSDSKSIIFWGLLVVTRPEGIAFVILAFLVDFFFNKSQKKLNYIALIFGVLVYLLHVYIRYQYYGYIFPNTYYLKLGSDKYSMVYEGVRYLKNYLITPIMLPFFISILVAFFYWMKTSTKTALDKYLIAVFVFWGSYLIYIGGDWIPGHRHMFVILPLALIFLLRVVISFYSTANLLRWVLFLTYGISILFWGYALLNHIDGDNYLYIGYLIFLIALLVLFFHRFKLLLLISISSAFSFNGAIASQSPEVKDLMIQNNIVDYLSSVGVELNKLLPGNVTIALNPAGALPFYSKFKVIDMLGLNDEFIAHQKQVRSHMEFSLMHDKSSPDYVLGRSPELIALGLFYTSKSKLDFDDKRFYRYKSDVDLLTHVKFKENYKLVSVGPVDLKYTPRYPLIYDAKMIEYKDAYINIFFHKDYIASLVSCSSHHCDEIRQFLNY